MVTLPLPAPAGITYSTITEYSSCATLFFIGVEEKRLVPQGFCRAVELDTSLNGGEPTAS